MMRLYDRLIIGLATCSGLIVAGICLLIIYDVIARNLGWQPPASTVALTEYAMLYLTMGAAPYLVRKRGHIVVEIFYRKLPPVTQRILDRCILLLCMTVALLVAVFALLLMVESIQRGEIEVRSLDTPRWILFAPLCIGFLLMATEFFRLFLRKESFFDTGAGQQDSL